jgi:lysophospholipase L1-like esterase
MIPDKSDHRPISLKAKVIFFLVPLLVLIFAEIIARMIIPCQNSMNATGKQMQPLIDFVQIPKGGNYPGLPEKTRNMIGLPLPMHPYHQVDDDLLYSLKPNFSFSFLSYGNTKVNYSTNSLGFRGDEFTIKKPDGKIRIICTGDSSTFGYLINIPDSYPDHLKNMLLYNTVEKNAEVINAGVIGYTSYQGLKLFKKTIRNLKPDILIASWGFNDSTCSRISQSKESKLALKAVGFTSVLSRLALYRMAETCINSLKNKFGHTQNIVPKVSLDEYRQNLEELAKYCTEDGIHLILLPITAPYPYCKTMQAVASAHPNVKFIDTEKILSGFYDKFQAEKATQYKGIPMWAVFKQNIDDNHVKKYGSLEMGRIREWTYLFIDFCHPTPVGYYIIAEAIYNYLIEQKYFTKSEGDWMHPPSVKFKDATPLAIPKING